METNLMTRESDRTGASGGSPRVKPAAGDDAPAGSPGTGENLCPECDGSGRIGNRSCPNCDGTGKVTEGIGGG
jgi:hypothetical protein